MLEYREVIHSRELSVKERDTRLLNRLQQLDEARGPLPESSFGLTFHNHTLAALARPEYTSAEFAPIQTALKDHGTLQLHVRKGHKVQVSGEPRRVALIAATESETNGDMSEMVWIRDQTQVATSLYEMWKQDPKKYKKEGKLARKVLLSTMHLMSSDAQLERFDEIIQAPDDEDGKKVKADYRNYPQIAINFTRLDSELSTEWRHKQEAWQMLGLTVLDALDQGLLHTNQLLDGHKQFLGSMMPFLESIDFTNQPNSGSWEEREAISTSVIGVETALLHKIQGNAGKPGFEFLREGFVPTQDGRSFEETLDGMIDQGLRKIGQNLPYESPHYDPSSPKYREADAALLYLLDYDIPKLLANAQIDISAAGNQPLSRMEIEKLILGEVGKLYDPVTHGLKRYEGDTYLSTSYTSDGMQEKIKQMKKTLAEEAAAENRPIDLDKKFTERQRIVKEALGGEDFDEAAWLHFNPQIAAWAARRFLESGNEWYYQVALEFQNRTFAMVTGKDEYYILPNKEGIHEIHSVPEWLLPEADMTMVTLDRKKRKVRSPNVPLNWGVGKTRESTALVGEAIARRNN